MYKEKFEKKEVEIIFDLKIKISLLQLIHCYNFLRCFRAIFNLYSFLFFSYKITRTRAVSAFTRHDESRRALAREASLVISTSTALAITQQALVDILASVSLLRESIVTVALVSVLGVYALPVSAYVRPQRALVYLGDRLQLLQAKPVVIVYN